MVNYYELVRDQIIYRFRSDVRRKIINKELKTAEDIIKYTADYVSKSMIRRELVTPEEAKEAVSMIDVDSVMQSVQNNCALSDKFPVIEKAVMNDFGENREDVCKSVLLYLLILKVVVSVIIIWWWQRHKKGKVLYYGRGIQSSCWRKNSGKVLKKDLHRSEE